LRNAVDGAMTELSVSSASCKSVDDEQPLVVREVGFGLGHELETGLMQPDWLKKTICWM